MSNKRIEIVPTSRNGLASPGQVRVQRVWGKLGSDVALMERRGATVQQRDEYVFEFLETLENRVLTEADEGGFDLLRGVKKMIADKIANALQINQGFLRDIVTNFIAGLNISDLKAMFSKGGCKKVVTKLSGAVQAAIVDQVLKIIGLAPSNFVSIAITEALKSGFVESGPFVKIVSDTVCNLNISELLPGGISGAASSIKGALSSFFGGGGSATAAPPTTPPAE